MGLGKKLKKLSDTAALKTIRALTPDGVEEDSYLDLKIEAIEGRQNRNYDEPEAPPATPAQPVYRADGQVHNFAAVPFPGAGRRLTRAQYEARYAGARPEPKHSVAKLVDVKEEPKPEPIPAHECSDSDCYACVFGEDIEIDITFDDGEYAKLAAEWRKEDCED